MVATVAVDLLGVRMPLHSEVAPVQIYAQATPHLHCRKRRRELRLALCQVLVQLCSVLLGCGTLGDELIGGPLKLAGLRSLLCGSPLVVVNAFAIVCFNVERDRLDTRDETRQVGRQGSLGGGITRLR